MLYFVVPVNNGLLDIDYGDLIEGIQTSATECYVKLRDIATIRDTWQAITEEQFNTIKNNLFEPPA